MKRPVYVRSQHWTDALLKHLHQYSQRSNINQILHGRYCVRTVYQQNIMYTGHFLERKNYISDPGKHDDKLHELLKKRHFCILVSNIINYFSPEVNLLIFNTNFCYNKKYWCTKKHIWRCNPIPALQHAEAHGNTYKFCISSTSYIITIYLVFSSSITVP